MGRGRVGRIEFISNCSIRSKIEYQLGLIKSQYNVSVIEHTALSYPC